MLEQTDTVKGIAFVLITSRLSVVACYIASDVVTCHDDVVICHDDVVTCHDNVCSHMS